MRGHVDLLTRRGRNVVLGNISDLRLAGAGWQVTGHEADRVVICLGPWSPELMARFGYRVPMVRKRGFHRHCHRAAARRRPVVDTDHGVVPSPMRAGLRMTSGAALVSPEAPASPVQQARGETALRGRMGLGPRAAPEPWFGHRPCPCLPDMLQQKGPLPQQARLWVNFGHGHQGFTLRPTTGTLWPRR